jgi:hypothetical protein
VHGVQDSREIESLPPGGIGQEVGVKSVCPVHQDHRFALAEVLEAEELAQWQDALVASKKHEAAERLGKGEGKTGYGHLNTTFRVVSV